MNKREQQIVFFLAGLVVTMAILGFLYEMVQHPLLFISVPICIMSALIGGKIWQWFYDRENFWE